jgi:hypothetical protein
MAADSIVGRNLRMAISVGTTALPMTVATSRVYCCCVMMPRFSPNSDAMVPKVRPVHTISVLK